MRDQYWHGLVMKCDEFAHIHLFPTPRIHPQVWNFRKCDLNLAVYGVGQCHQAGINHVIAELTKDHGSIVWCNMREEPVVFLDGQACAPRTANNLNENVEYLQSIEDFELRCDGAALVSRLWGGGFYARSLLSGERHGERET